MSNRKVDEACKNSNLWRKSWIFDFCGNKQLKFGINRHHDSLQEYPLLISIISEHLFVEQRIESSVDIFTNIFNKCFLSKLDTSRQNLYTFRIMKSQIFEVVVIWLVLAIFFQPNVRLVLGVYCYRLNWTQFHYQSIT